MIIRKILLKIIYSLEKLSNKIKWNLEKSYINEIGKNNQMGKNFHLKGTQYMSIGDNFFAGEDVKLEVWDSYQGIKLESSPKLVIGEAVKISSGCHISCADSITINDGVLLGPNVFICDNYHGHNCWEEREIPPADRPLWIKGKVRIGKNVWVGRNVCIMPNVSIGDGVIIGANAVVTHDIPSYVVVAGIPAKIISKIDKHT